METYNVTIKKDSTVKKPIESKLQKGCTTLMYACQQGLTNDVVKELRTNVSHNVILYQLFKV